jgi:hypothetical protein
MKLENWQLRYRLEFRHEKSLPILGLGGAWPIQIRCRSFDMLHDRCCYTFTFGNRDNIPWVEHDDMSMTMGGHVEIQSPQKGDLAIYIGVETSSMFDPTYRQIHVGRFFDEKRVISKWCWGNVYLHPIESVPYGHAVEARFFRKQGQA